MPRKNYEKLFISFLRSNNAYDIFVANLKAFKPRGTTLENFLTIIHYTGWVDYAFHWGATRQGHNYWAELHRKWIDYCVSGPYVSELNKNIKTL